MHPVGAVAVPLAPEAGAGVIAIASLGVFLIFLVCLGLREGWDHTIGGALRWLANQVRGVVIDLGWFGTYHVLDPVADAIEWVANSVSHLLAKAALETEQAAASLWHLAGRVFWWSVHETKSLAVDAWHLFHHTIVVTIPDAGKWAYRQAVDRAHALVDREEAARRAADAELARLARIAEHDAHVGIVKAEAALDWSEVQVGQLGDYIKGIRARVGRLERLLLTTAGITGLLIAALDRLGLRWLRCGNTRNVGRRLCGMGTDLLDALLLGTLAVEGSVSLVGMAHELVGLSGDIVPAMTGFFSELAAIPQRTAAEQGLA